MARASHGPIPAGTARPLVLPLTVVVLSLRRESMRGPRQPSNGAVIPAALAVLGATAFRMPELLNPGVVNSDSAVVGLQAMHLLRGEWQWFLWGSGYQTTTDSVVAAGLFLVLGATPLAVMMTALLGHLLVTLFAFLTLRRRLPPFIALLLVAPLMASPAPLHTYSLHPPRQTALTLVFAAIWLLDGAAGAKRENTRFVLGAAIGAIACFADPYALVFAPGIALLALLSGFDGLVQGGRTLRRLVAAVVGATFGAIPFLIIRLLPRASPGPLTLTQALLARNWGLLKGPCLSWVLGTRVLHQPPGASDYVLWHPPWAFQFVQWAGALILAGVLMFAVGSVARDKVPWELRRLGLMAALTVLTTVLGFLFSVMPMDHYASRYLVAIVLVIPFIFSIVAYWLPPRSLFALMAPMIASFAVSGWLGYEPFVRGFRILDAGLERDETRLFRELESRGIAYATADYWAAYRLTFMSKEGVVVVPIHESQDRYAPYRKAFLNASRYAYIYDHRRSEESQQTVENRVKQDQQGRFTVGGFDVYVMKRPASASKI